MDIPRVFSTLTDDIQKLWAKPEEPKKLHDSRIMSIALRAIGVVVGIYSSLSMLSIVITSAAAPLSATVLLVFWAAIFAASHDAVVVGQNISNQLNSLTDLTFRAAVEAGSTLCRGLTEAAVNGTPTVLTDTWIAIPIYKLTSSKSA